MKRFTKLFTSYDKQHLPNMIDEYAEKHGVLIYSLSAIDSCSVFVVFEQHTNPHQRNSDDDACKLKSELNGNDQPLKPIKAISIGSIECGVHPASNCFFAQTNFRGKTYSSFGKSRSAATANLLDSIQALYSEDIIILKSACRKNHYTPDQVRDSMHLENELKG